MIRSAPDLWLIRMHSWVKYDKAVGWLKKAYDDRDFGLFCVRDPALPAAMRATPRRHALMQRPAFREIARVRQQILARDS